MTTPYSKAVFSALSYLKQRRDIEREACMCMHAKSPKVANNLNRIRIIYSPSKRFILYSMSSPTLSSLH